jgi:hypothetical protein
MRQRKHFRLQQARTGCWVSNAACGMAGLDHAAKLGALHAQRALEVANDIRAECTCGLHAGLADYHVITMHSGAVPARGARHCMHHSFYSAYRVHVT